MVDEHLQIIQISKSPWSSGKEAGLSVQT